MTLISIYVGGTGGISIDAISTNEPNKIQIAELLIDVVAELKLPGDLSKGEYKDLGRGNKSYKYNYGDTKLLVIIKRLPIIEFEKADNKYKYVDLNPYI